MFPNLPERRLAHDESIIGWQVEVARDNVKRIDGIKLLYKC